MLRFSPHANQLSRHRSASGLGRACCEDIVAQGGHVAVLDQNEENGQEFTKTLGLAARFFVCDVLESESIAKAVQGTAEWAKESGKPIGGAITAAGVALPAPVCALPLMLIQC